MVKLIINENSLGTSNCESCDTSKHRIAITSTGACICAVGYYDDNTNELCAACYAGCVSCNQYFKKNKY